MSLQCKSKHLLNFWDTTEFSLVGYSDQITDIKNVSGNLSFDIKAWVNFILVYIRNLLICVVILRIQIFWFESSG